MNLDQLFFLSIALFGALFLFISFLIGEIGDAFDSFGDMAAGHLGIGDGGGGLDMGDDGPSPLSLRNLMAFMTAYGASGMITSAFGWSTVASSFFAILPGLVIGAIAWKSISVLYGQQASSVVEVSSLVGRRGIVDLGIPIAGMGRITVNTGTGQSTFLARSENSQPIATGEIIIITGVLGSDLIVARASEGAGG